MTTADLPTDAESPLPAGSLTGPGLLGRTRAAWDRLDVLLESWSDRFNPILVKETRQALKSRQFVATFALLLLACWIVSIGGVALIGTQIYYTAVGASMFFVYYAILALPLLVVVPFSAFRSLAAERDDNTFELLSISTLTSRQIIRGKLGSAILQMLVYCCAVAPCLVFTYLLRGVDVFSVVILLGGTLAASIGLSMVGLFMATSSPRGYRQAAPLMFLAAVLFGAFFASLALAQSAIRIGFEIWSDPAFWPVFLAIVTFYVTTFMMCSLASAAQLTFGSENRSTPLRRMVVVNQAALTGWTIYLCWYWGTGSDAAMFVAVTSGLICFVTGSLMVAERADMPHRVRRHLPHSMLGRILLTWFNPGPGTGLMFSLANAAVAGIAALTILGLSDAFPLDRRPGRPRAVGLSEFGLFLIVAWCYLAIYLGIGKLAIGALKKVSIVTMLGALLINVLLVLIGCGIPLIPQLFGSDLPTGSQHWLMRLLNPFYTLNDLLTGTLESVERYGTLFVVGGMAICALLLNLRSVFAEMSLVFEAAPHRVQEDDATKLPPEPPTGPTNPWEADSDE